MINDGFLQDYMLASSLIPSPPKMVDFFNKLIPWSIYLRRCFLQNWAANLDTGLVDGEPMSCPDFNVWKNIFRFEILIFRGVDSDYKKVIFK